MTLTMKHPPQTRGRTLQVDTQVIEPNSGGDSRFQSASVGSFDPKGMCLAYDGSKRPGKQNV
jgi:hypothetical protein